MMGDRHQRVELAAQLAQLAVHRRRRGVARRRLPGPPLQLLVLALVQQGAHLLGVQQTRDAEVVGLLLAAGRGGGTERRAVEDDLIEFRVGPQRGEAVVEFALLVLRAGGRVAVEGSPSETRCGSPSTWLRWASSSLASCSRLGTDGRKMLAVSPGRRDRTNRPTAWAKNSGVEALVA